MYEERGGFQGKYGKRRKDGKMRSKDESELTESLTGKARMRILPSFLSIPLLFIMSKCFSTDPENSFLETLSGHRCYDNVTPCVH